jgi:hypothetical protein
MKRFSLAVLAMLLFAPPAFAQLIISETLANEPGNRTLLEWIEIYNKNTDSISLGSISLIVNNDTLALPETISVAPSAYAVLCRRLLPRLGSDCFESYWGDSSGVWGDCREENYLAFEVPIVLPNASGHVQLLDSLDGIIDECEWHSACADGQSLERDDVDDYTSGWHPCADSLGSTPGRPNSEILIEPTDYSFNVTPKVIRLSDILVSFTIDYTIPEGAAVSIIIFDDSARKRKIIIDNSSMSSNTIYWRGENSNGEIMSPGLYFMKVKISGSLNVNEMIPLVISP